MPDSGAYLIDGRVRRKDRASVFDWRGVGQRSRLWWGIPILDLFELRCETYAAPQAEYARKLKALMAMIPLGELLNAPVRQLFLPVGGKGIASYLYISVLAAASSVLERAPFAARQNVFFHIHLGDPAGMQAMHAMALQLFWLAARYASMGLRMQACRSSMR